MQHVDRMNVQKRVEAFEKLGHELKILANEIEGGHSSAQVEELCGKVYAANGFFDRSSLVFALKGICELLVADSLRQFVSKYSFDLGMQKLRIGVIMAGNIPAVNFADFLYVLLSGHQFVGKLASGDPYLMPFLSQKLTEIEPEFADRITFERGIMKDFDAVIATGSNNSSRYFKHYFSKYPHIIRKNRTSVAVVDGAESVEKFKQLETDLFRYYGLGCRNVSKIYFPKSFDPKDFLSALEPPMPLTENKKYRNNYEYYKAIYLLNKVPHLDNGQFIMMQSTDLHPPVGVVYYDFYDSIDELNSQLIHMNEELQCVVAEIPLSVPSVSFGRSQLPGIFDYPDNVDVGAFLMNIC